MAINFPNSPSNGDTHTAGGKTFTYDATAGVWNSSGSGVTEFTGLSDTPSTLGTAGQVAKVNSGATALEFADPSGVTVYATADLLPGTANAGDMAFVTATNRLYLWNGSGWYNIALINTNPTISGVSSSYALATDGTATTVTITATDPEGVPITYSIASDTSGNIATVSQGTGSNSNVFTITPSTDSANGGSFSLTFRASDGVNIASSVSTFTLSFSVVNSKYTTALITSVGANNAVNNSFTDSSGNSHAITSVGGASQGTFSPFRQNGYSWLLDSNGDYLSVPAHTSFDFGSGDFTVEFWMHPNSIPSGESGLVTLYQYSSNRRSWYVALDGSSLELRLSSSGTAADTLINSASGVFETNTWYHVAMVREGNNITGYVNGTSVVTGTHSGAVYGNTSDPVIIGSVSTSLGGTEYDGYITDIRVVKGTAVYTEAFTPPTERLTAVTNTSLLIGNLPYLADGSTNNHKLASNGDPSMEAFTPYDNANTYAAADHDAGVSFNGTDAYVRSDTAVDAFPTAGTAWTIEGWVYPRDLGGVNAGADYWVSANRASDGLYVFAMGPQQLAYDNNNESGLTDMKLKQWHHVAVVNSGGYMGMKYFINGYHVNSYNPSGSAPALDVARFTIGAATQGSNASIANQFNGVVSNVRVSDTNLYTNSDYLPTNPPTQTFTPPTAPFTTNSNTDFLLYGRDGAIIDKSQGSSAVTLGGSSKSSTTQTKYLTSSVELTGTDPNVQIETPSLGSVFTMEGWFYVTNYNTYGGFFSGSNNNTNASARGISVAYDGIKSDAQTTMINWNSTLPTNAWVHIAVTSDGTTLRAFVDGTLQTDTHTTVSDFTQTTTTYRIGARYNSGASALYTLTGFFSDVRFSKGLARYTANFTPPTAALQG